MFSPLHWKCHSTHYLDNSKCQLYQSSAWKNQNLSLIIAYYTCVFIKHAIFEVWMYFVAKHIPKPKNTHDYVENSLLNKQSDTQIISSNKAVTWLKFKWLRLFISFRVTKYRLKLNLVYIIIKNAFCKILTHYLLLSIFSLANLTQSQHSSNLPDLSRNLKCTCIAIKFIILYFKWDLTRKKQSRKFLFFHCLHYHEKSFVHLNNLTYCVYYFLCPTIYEYKIE